MKTLVRRAALIDLVLVVTVILPGAARAESIASTDSFVPVVSITGATGVFRSDVHIFNPEPEQKAQVTLYFTKADTNGLDSPGLRIDPDVQPRETVTLVDIVANYLGERESYGLLEVKSSVPVLVTSNTYNVAGAVPGTYGQYAPGQPARAALPFIDSVEGDLYITGLPNDANHRTNAVVMNPSGVELEAGVELVDAVGNRYGKRTYTVPPFSMHQLNDVFGDAFASFGPPGNGKVYRLNAYVNLDNGAKILCYATVTDKRTGDPYLIPGQAKTP